MSKKTLIALVLITLLAAALRFWQLDNLPAQLNRDEAAIGLNAKLLAETGKDEWGRTWPLALESFGDYKLPGYVWLTIIAGQLFGWHDWVLRLPSVLAGSVLPLLVYYWLKKLQKPERQAVWTALFMAVLPVSWFYSRMAFEANVALSLLIFWFILVAEKQRSLENKWLDLGLVLTSVLLVLTYNTPLLLLPFMLFYLVFYWQLKNWRNWLGVWLLLCGITTGGFYLLSQLFGQKSGITLFTDPSIWTFFVEGRETRTGLAKILQSNWYGYLGSAIVTRFFASWSPVFLVTKGGMHPWHALPNASHLLWTHYILGIVGFFTAAFQLLSKLKPSKLFVHLAQSDAWLVFLTMIALAPAVITTDAPHATRSLLFFVLLVVWAGQGLEFLLNYSKKTARLISWIVGIILLIETARYGYLYFVSYSQNQAVFQPGLSDTIAELNRSYPTGPVAVVGDGYSYAIWAWYLQLSSEQFFETVIKQLPDRIGFRYGQQIDRFHFIMDPADRDQSEPVLVEWRDNHWQIKTF